MFSTVLSATIDGLKVEFVQVEVDVSNGLPVFHMVGYLSAEVKEATERVKTAIRNVGISLPPKRITVNLSPATVKKRGAAFDLPVAVGVLAAYGHIREHVLDKTLVIGELGLDGEVRKVPGILPVILEGKKKGYETFLIPEGNQREGMVIEHARVICVRHLQQVLEYAQDPEGWTGAYANKQGERCLLEKVDEEGDFRDIQGQEGVKRIAEIAVAGQHNLLLVGGPGCGKTMLAKRIPTIFPPLSMEERIEISKIYSIMGLLDEESGLVEKRPFRQVHHTVTKTALIGGGRVPSPGEITLASGGILMMDEIAEFPRPVLEVLRQPLEEQIIRIVRAKGAYEFPADFLLVAAMNPCPCGCYPDLNRCTCTDTEIRAYQSRISQPFLSRIDICTEAPKVEYSQLSQTKEGESSETIRQRVCRARGIQKKRYAGRQYQTNGRMKSGDIATFCRLDGEGELLMKRAYDRMRLTARTYHKVLRVARTIADLASEEHIRKEHLSEALGYRVMDKEYWGNGR